jgi:putative transposase
MSFNHTTPASSTRCATVLTSFLQHDGLPFADLLPEEDIQRAFDEAGASFAQDEPDGVYTPAVTLWAFLSQVLFKGEQRSCLAAVSRIVVLLVALGRKPCSKNTGAYCRARAKIPTEVVRKLTCDLAAAAERRLPEDWLWCGRSVELVDGFTISGPDTVKNQEEYPQPSTQEPGVGFPLCRCVIRLSFATGMAADLEIGPYSGKETGETALLRKMLEKLGRNTILLADRYYCSYFIIALLIELDIDFVLRLHQCRTANFRRGQRLGRGDHIVDWVLPAKPKWMDDETYGRMPPSIKIREVEVRVRARGFRETKFVVVTRLFEALKYTADDIAALYRKRWLAELDIRAIKSTLGFDILRCQTPEMLRKELWVALLAYNLIRQTMLNAAHRAEVLPRALSFAHALQTVAASWTTVLVLSSGRREALIDAAIQGLRRPLVGRRPDRVEPRATKRRPKPTDFLTKPRAEARADLMGGNKT